jgi:hypothetical protein
MWIGFAACGGASSSHAPDAAPDAGGCVPWECFGDIACSADQAVRTGGGELPCGLDYHACTVDHATCTAGCALAIDVPGGYDFQGSVAVLCAETPAAQVGDPCDRNCLPTRASIAADGTVTQQYLACADDPTTGASACAAAPAPIVASYLQPCAPYQLADAGNYPGQDGVIDESCLIAWDGTTLHAGTTFRCLGDWQCPDGSLCDDQLFYAGEPERSPGVCKPGGPRGVIDPLRLPAT